MSKDSMSLVQANPCMYDRPSPNYLKKLCSLVQANPCMYDRSSPNYQKKEYVDRAWAKIAKDLNDSVGSCKERWRNIRTAFARSVNIYKTPSGPNRHKRYYLHDELQFLTKHISPGLPSLPIRILTPTELEENLENSQQSMDVQVDDNCTFQITIDSSSPTPPVLVEEEQVTTPESEPEVEPEPELSELPSSPVMKRRKMPDPEDVLKEFLNKQRNKDPDLKFLNSLLPEMKSMNARQKILFKGKIYRVLEEVFDDFKDFPKKSQPVINGISVTSPSSGKNYPNKSSNTTCNSAAQTRPERRDAHTSTSPYNLHHAPMVTLGHNDFVIKQEPVSVNVDD